MGFRRRAGGGKRDAAEKAIVEALEAHGAKVWRLGGTGCPDLLVAYRDRYVPLEVKSGKGSLTRNQGTIPWPVVRSEAEALQAIGLKR